MHHPSRHTLPSQSVQIRPLLPLLTSTLRVQGAIYVSTLQPEPPGLTSSLLDGGRHVPPQMSIMSTASCSCCRGPAVSHHTERNPEGPLVPWPRPPLRPHLLPLSLLLTRSKRVSLPAGPRTSQSFPVSGRFVLLFPPYSSFWGKRLWDLHIILISVESGPSSHLSFSETLS